MLATNYWPFIQSFALQIAPWLVPTLMLYFFLKGKNIASDNKILAEKIKEKTEQLRTLALKYEAILKYVGEGIVTMDIHGRIEFINRTALNWLGYSKEEVENQNKHEFLHHTKRDGTPFPSKECSLHGMFTEHKYDVNTSLDELTYRNQDFLIKKDGTFLEIEYVATPLFDYQDKYIGAVLVWHPIRNLAVTTKDNPRGGEKHVKNNLTSPIK